jgi:hypothetical protein
MRLHAAAIAAAGAALVLAGLFLAASGPRDNPPADATPGLPESLGEGTMVWSDCSSWRLTAYAPESAAMPRPAAWGRRDDPLAALVLHGFACQRVSLGAFERGPVHLILDTHDDARFPEPCRAAGPDGEPDGLHILANLWVDDAEIAARLHGSYGMPARLAAIEADSTQGGAAQVHGWRWSEAGQEASSVNVLEDEATEPMYEGRLRRLLWSNGAGVASLDLLTEGSGPSGPRLATGHFEPPTLMAALAGELAGPGEWLPQMEAKGRFTLHADPHCGGAA